MRVRYPAGGQELVGWKGGPVEDGQGVSRRLRAAACYRHKTTFNRPAVASGGGGGGAIWAVFLPGLR